ncbi:MAG TPA: hypothetical protein VJT75_07635 [Thermoleophilaceae bacterium]|nr:hypothetical protein [Thermoleophilaceae bacterium]
MEGLYSRRTLVTRGSALVAAIAGLGSIVAPGWARKPKIKTRNVWRLDPLFGNCKKHPRGRGCAACNACVNHAKNKRFATRHAADTHRAHKHCNCKVVKGGKISRSAYNDLFGKPGALHARQIDLRNASKRKKFKAGRAAVLNAG